MAKIEVFTGTGMGAIPDVGAGESLFGVYYAVGRKSSANLTTHLPSAVVFAQGAESAGRGHAVILQYHIPEQSLKTANEGKFGIDYYSTDWVEPAVIPEEVLRFMGFPTLEAAIRRVATQEIRFNQVRAEYFKGFIDPHSVNLS